MAGQHQPCSPLAELVERRKDRADPEIVGDDSVLQRNVEVDANEDASPGEVTEVLDGAQAPPRPAYSLDATSSVSSTSRFEYPHSLSYQPMTLTRFPIAMVDSASKTQE